MHSSILVELKKIVLLSFVFLLFSTAVIIGFVRPVVAEETIYIRPDGTVEGTDKIQRDGNIYTFTENISDSIIVERDNIVVDGAGYTVQGTGTAQSVGIGLWHRNNVTLRNIEVTNFDYGIFSYQSLNNSLSGNRIADNNYGIKFDECSKNHFFGNEITSNGIGVMFGDSHNNNFSRNNITLNRNGIYFQGIKLYNGYGISFARSSNNIIYGNNIANNEEGVSLSNSPSNNVSLNNITSNQYGIVLRGPYMYDSGENIIYGNNITDNNSGIQVISPGNSIYYNNFINNTNQVHTDIYSTFQANYWSDYTGKDRNGDNIGDTPYGDYLDRYPLMKPWTLEWSPKPSVDQALEEEIPFWMQWWFWTIVAVVIVTLAGTVYFLKKRKLPTPTSPALPSKTPN